MSSRTTDVGLWRGKGPKICLTHHVKLCSVLKHHVGTRSRASLVHNFIVKVLAEALCDVVGSVWNFFDVWYPILTAIRALSKLRPCYDEDLRNDTLFNLLTWFALPDDRRRQPRNGNRPNNRPIVASRTCMFLALTHTPTHERARAHVLTAFMNSENLNEVDRYSAKCLCKRIYLTKNCSPHPPSSWPGRTSKRRSLAHWRYTVIYPATTTTNKWPIGPLFIIRPICCTRLYERQLRWRTLFEERFVSFAVSLRKHFIA